VLFAGAGSFRRSDFRLHRQKLPQNFGVSIINVLHILLAEITEFFHANYIQIFFAYGLKIW